MKRHVEERKAEAQDNNEIQCLKLESRPAADCLPRNLLKLRSSKHIQRLV